MASKGSIRFKIETCDGSLWVPNILKVFEIHEFVYIHTFKVQSSEALTSALTEGRKWSPLTESICDFRLHLF